MGGGTFFVKKEMHPRALPCWSEMHGFSEFYPVCAWEPPLGLGCAGTSIVNKRHIIGTRT